MIPDLWSWAWNMLTRTKLEDDSVDTLTSSRITGGNPITVRDGSDYYPTPPEATVALLNFLELPKSTVIWEPACGGNHMVDVMRDREYRVIGTDIQTGDDFLDVALPHGVEWIITNPPFSKSEEFIRRCVWHGKPFALLLKSQYWHAKKRLRLFTEYSPAYILPLTWRPDFLLGARGGASLMDVIWCVWDPRITGRTRYIPLERPGVEG